MSRTAKDKVMSDNEDNMKEVSSAMHIYQQLDRNIDLVIASINNFEDLVKVKALGEKMLSLCNEHINGGKNE